MATPATPVGYSTPYTQTSTSTSGLGAAAAPYGQDVMAQAYALSSQDPYHAYSGQTVAGPTGLQQTAADSVSGLNAGNLATQAQSLTSQGANYTPGTHAFGLADAQAYMNPYQQGVIDVANNEAGRQSEIQGTYDASKAAQAGAFGGSRDGIVNAERERTLALLKNNNQMQGNAAAFTNAQSQFNADQNRQMQGDQYASQAALAGGNALTNQANQAFGMQQISGAQQQAAAQGQLTQDKANFDGAVQHPYDQINFMTNTLKALPSTATSTTVDYSPDNSASQPNGVNQAADTIGGIAGLISGGKGLWNSISSLFAGGGMVQSGLPQARIAQIYEKGSK